MADNNQLAKSENPQDVLLTVIETGPEILMQNQDQLEKTQAAVRELLEEIASKGMTDELDAYCNRVQLRIKEVYSEMVDNRKPLTSGMDKVKAAFTQLEAVIDPGKPESLFNQVGKERNKYAAQKAEIQKRKEEEARKKLQMDQERNRLIGEAELQLRNGFITYLHNYKQSLQDVMNRLTLESYDITWDEVHNWPSEYEQEAFNHIDINLRAVYLQPEEVVQIKQNARTGKFESFAAEYRSSIESMKKEMLDKLPGMKTYLQEVRQKEEEQRRKDEEAKRLREEAKQIADAEERKRKEEEAKRQEAEAQRQREENQKLEEERKQKEEAERIRLEEERRKKEEEAAEKAKVDEQVRNATSLFDNVVDTTVSGDEGPTVVESWKIEVKAPAGVLHIVSHFFTFAGNQMTVEELMTKTVLQMKTFCEKDFKKNTRKIDSPLVEYVPQYKVKATK